MAKTTTTATSAIGVNDTSITVASATGFAASSFVRINGECLQVAKGYVSGTTIPVMRGIEGTAALAHAITSNVTVGLASDFVPLACAPGEAVNYPLIRSRQMASYNAAGAIAHPTAGNDAVAIINGTVARALTLAVPAKDQDGDVLTIVGNGKAAHTVTVSGGIGAAGAGYTVYTMITGSQQAIQLMACNGAWVQLPSQLSGTLTNTLVALA
jgi:hypothetical protein